MSTYTDSVLVNEHRIELIHDNYYKKFPLWKNKYVTLPIGNNWYIYLGIKPSEENMPSAHPYILKPLPLLYHYTNIDREKSLLSTTEVAKHLVKKVQNIFFSKP